MASEPRTAGYIHHLRSLVDAAPPTIVAGEPAGSVRVERAAVLADAMAGRAVATPRMAATVVDAAGHRRPVYRPLLAHAYRLAAGLDARASLDAVGDVPFTAANGAAAAAAVWTALALDDHRTFAALAAAQQRGGPFLRATSADNPEVHWFHELVILHAAADYAAATGDAAVTAAVERATLFHLEETETDHATGRPWGLPAFVRVAGAEPLVGAALHAVAAHQPAGPTGLALFLLADTLYGLTRPDRGGAT